MPRRILIPVDGSTRSLEAVEYGCVLFPDAEITLAHVVDPGEEWQEGPGYPDRWEERAEREATSLLAEAAERAERHGIDVETTVEWGEPYRRILELIDRTDTDHVLLGSTGESVTGRFLLGGVSEVVLGRSPVPVTVVRSPVGSADESGIRPPTQILAPLDGSDSAYEGLKYALEQFPDPEPTVTALVVCELDIDDDRLAGTYLETSVRRAHEEADQILSTARDAARDRGVEIQTATTFGTPARAIVEYADRKDVDHVVVGSRGRSRVSRLLLGSVAEAVAKRAPVTVTVFR